MGLSVDPTSNATCITLTLTMSTQEATINPDGTTTFTTDGDASDGFDDTTNTGGEFFNATGGADGAAGGGTVDPAIYLGLVFALVVVVAVLIFLKRRKREDGFFSQLDGEKFNLKLPAAVDEYYEIKDKCLDQGWEPGQKADGPPGAANGPHRVLAQALMKRCIADIPLVTHIQKESAGMNKLYSNSMCSVKQWKTYQAAETMVSNEVDEVRAEADEVEPGWSQVIWRQAMQYHNMLKQRHEMEAKELAAEQAAADLIKAEEREKDSKSAFGNGSMKKGFLTAKPKKKA